MRFVVSLVAIALVGSVLFVVLLALFIRGEGEGGEQERTEKQKERKIEYVTGTVSGVDREEHTVTITYKNEKRSTFAYTPDKVKVTLEGEQVGPDAIEKGQTVRIKYVRGYTKKGGEEKFTPSIKILSGPGATPGGETTG